MNMMVAWPLAWKPCQCAASQQSFCEKWSTFKFFTLSYKVFFLLWKFWWEQIFFMANTICMLLLILMMIATYQASGLVWWTLVFYITLTFCRLGKHFYSWSTNHLKDQDTDNLEELKSSSVGFYNIAPILLISFVSSP